MKVLNNFCDLGKGIVEDVTSLVRDQQFKSLAAKDKQEVKDTATIAQIGLVAIAAASAFMILSASFTLWPIVGTAVILALSLDGCRMLQNYKHPCFFDDENNPNDLLKKTLIVGPLVRRIV